MTNTRKLLPVFWVLALLTLAVPLAQAQDAGTVDRVSGTASIVNAANQSRVVRSGEPIRAGETITTQSGGEVLLKMKDDSVLVLRQNTQLKLTEFRYEDKPTDSIFASLVKGAVRSVSGLLGKARPSNVKFATSTATVGIRGTDFEIAIVPEGSSDGRAGTYDYVYDGATNIQIASGQSLDVKPEQTGLAVDNPKPGEEPLQLLKEKPAFLSGGGFDAIIIQLTQPMNIMPRMR
jgi:FecR protein